MRGQAGFWDIEDRLKELSAEGDPLEKLSATVDFEMFRPLLEKAVRRSGTSKGGRPGFDVVLKCHKVPQRQNPSSSRRTQRFASILAGLEVKELR